MPTYKVTDPDTGMSRNVTGDSPPTEAELNEIFKAVKGAGAIAAPSLASAPEDTKLPRSLGQRLKGRLSDFTAAAFPSTDVAASRTIPQRLEADWNAGGAMAGAAGDIMGAVMDPAIRHLSGAVNDVSAAASKLMPDKGPAKAPPKFMQDAFTAAQEWAKAHPRTTKAVESGVNMASLLPIGRGGRAAGAELGGAELAGKAAGRMEQATANQTKKDTLELTKEKLTRKVAEKFEAGKTEKGPGFFGRTQLKTTDQDRAIAASVQDVVKKNAHPSENIDAIFGKIRKAAEATDAAVVRADKNREAMEAQRAASAEAVARATPPAPASFTATVEPAANGSRFIVKDRPNGYVGRAGSPTEYTREEASRIAERLNVNATTSVPARTLPKPSVITDLNRAFREAKTKSKDLISTVKDGKKNYDTVSRIFNEGLKGKPETLKSILDARRELDQALTDRFGRGVWEKDSAMSRAVEDIRRAANRTIQESMPGDGGKTVAKLLEDQHLMYQAKKHIAQNAAKDLAVPQTLGQKLLFMAKKHPYLTGEAIGATTAGAAATTFGIGGALVHTLSNPAVLASLAAYGSVRMGRAVYTSAQVRRFLANTLKAGAESFSEQELSRLKSIDMLLGAGALGTQQGVSAAVPQPAEVQP